MYMKDNIELKVTANRRILTGTRVFALVAVLAMVFSVFAVAEMSNDSDAKQVDDILDRNEYDDDFEPIFYWPASKWYNSYEDGDDMSDDGDYGFLDTLKIFAMEKLGALISWFKTLILPHPAV